MLLQKKCYNFKDSNLVWHESQVKKDGELHHRIFGGILALDFVLHDRVHAHRKKGEFYEDQIPAGGGTSGRRPAVPGALPSLIRPGHNAP